MKVTVAFLGQKNKSSISKIFNKICINIYWIVYFAICIGIMYLIVNHTKISSSILMFATNFRETKNEEHNVLELALSNGIFNKNNYKLTEKVEENEEVIQASVSENLSEYEVLDVVAKESDTQSVFATIPEAVITSENNTLQRISIGNTNLLNYSSKRSLDFSSFISKNIYLTKKNDKIFLYSTHTSESYTNSEKYQFEYSGIMRTTDANFNMLKIAKELNANLLTKGFYSVHNTTPHDYGSYTSAYSKSRATVTEALNNMGGASISIDVHRDAIEDLTYRPIADVRGVQVAQLMLVIGVGYDSDENPYYEDNLALALQIQMLADKVYPGLFKPMIIRDATYNQDLNKYSILVEVGATGNTIDEAMLATRCLTNLLNILYKD
ncbi:MAG: stage II sporulation protein P [Clostridia bacterium]|nr:stage II sporulation protein P [Clostridia bacterium]